MTTDDLVDPAGLTAFLRQRGLSAAVPAVRRIGLGQSNPTFLVQTPERRLVLRRPPPGPLPPRAHDVLREWRVISALHGGPVPVPAPIAAGEDTAVIGAPFLLMEAVDGDAIRSELPAGFRGDDRRSIGEQAVDALAALHRLDPVAVGLADLGPPDGYLARQLRRWRGQLEHARVRDAPDLETVADWLEASRPTERGPARIVHGDYKLDNLLFARQPPARLLAVVDWEMATLGDPLADLGWLLAFWREPGDPPSRLRILPRVTELAGFPSRAELSRRYAERVGAETPDLSYHVVLARWKLAVILEGHWARHVRGTASGFDFGYLESAGPAYWEEIRRSIG
ncbi:MAG TPA: phosphotransferase family protein [Chloroflexota bacterium]